MSYKWSSLVYKLSSLVSTSQFSGLWNFLTLCKTACGVEKLIIIIIIIINALHS